MVVRLADAQRCACMRRVRPAAGVDVSLHQPCRMHNVSASSGPMLHLAFHAGGQGNSNIRPTCQHLLAGKRSHHVPAPAPMTRAHVGTRAPAGGVPLPQPRLCTRTGSATHAPLPCMAM